VRRTRKTGRPRREERVGPMSPFAGPLRASWPPISLVPLVVVKRSLISRSGAGGRNLNGRPSEAIGRMSLGEPDQGPRQRRHHRPHRPRQDHADGRHPGRPGPEGPSAAEELPGHQQERSRARPVEDRHDHDQPRRVRDGAEALRAHRLPRPCRLRQEHDHGCCPDGRRDPAALGRRRPDAADSRAHPPGPPGRGAAPACVREQGRPGR